jgi:hypothetical protein
VGLLQGEKEIPGGAFSLKVSAPSPYTRVSSRITQAMGSCLSE